MRRLIHWLLRVSGGTFILVLPIGYYPENPDSSNVMIGVHGGGGQVMSVVRDCSGNPMASSANGYTDVAGSGYFALPESPVVFGVRGGYFESNALEASTYITAGGRQKISFSYVNPNISFEAKNIGFGAGLLIGRVPLRLQEYFDSDPERVRFSSHLRAGSLNSVYFMTSVAENTPLISGGSWFDIGLGYLAAPGFRGFSGLSAGMYDRAGFLQQAQIRVHRNIDLDFALRLGGAADGFEGGASVGLIYRFGATGRRDGPARQQQIDSALILR